MDAAASWKKTMVNQMMNRPNIKATGKPSAKIFICGAALVMMPNAKFDISKAVKAGNASNRALEKPS